MIISSIILAKIPVHLALIVPISYASPVPTIVLLAPALLIVTPAQLQPPLFLTMYATLSVLLAPTSHSTHVHIVQHSVYPAQGSTVANHVPQVTFYLQTIVS